MRVEFSNYLHDDVLQNVIAIKNLLSLENSDITHGFIVNGLNDLVSGIRDEIDTYHLIVPSNRTMKKTYSLFLMILLKGGRVISCCISTVRVVQ